METPPDFRWQDAAPGRWFTVNGVTGLAVISAGRKWLLSTSGWMRPSDKAPALRVDPDTIDRQVFADLTRKEKCLRSRAEADALLGIAHRKKFPGRGGPPEIY